MSEEKNTAKGPGGHGGPFGGGVPMGGAKAKDFKGSMKKLLGYIGCHKVALVFVLLFAIGAALFAIVSPKILGLITEELFRAVVAGAQTGTILINFALINQIAFWLLIIYFTSALFSYLQGFIMSGVANKVTYRLRKDISQKINRLPLSYFDTRNFGEVLSFITNDVDAISQSLSQSLTQIISSITMLVGILVMMLTISPSMTLVALTILPVSLVIVTVLVKKSQKYFKAQQEYLGHVNGHIEEMFGSHVIVKAFNGEKDSVETFEAYNKQLRSSAWRSQFLSNLMQPLIMFVGNLGYVGVCILGGVLATMGRISIGDIQAFMQYIRQFTQPISQVANISNVLQQTAAASERVFAFLAEAEEIADARETASTEGMEGDVTFDHVHFGYNPEKIIVNDFTAHIKQGQKVAIVGPTGAGKTTMIKLLMRFYDVTDGGILIDGVNIKDFSRNDLRAMFGMVLQDTWLYNTTIRENIRYGRTTATDDEVTAAAKSAQVHHFVRTLPKSYDMVLSEDAGNVSAGQKQLLTIARAILADPKILILDEATSSVDTRTEQLIQKAMDNLMKGRTSFIIAHRLSTIKNADLILVMKDGDIIEQGSHDVLMAQNGFYENLYTSQFEKSE